jgi:hypothetical protein
LDLKFFEKILIFFFSQRTLLKGEIGNAVTGKQWMLSCFGPFKGSVVIPNFIPDRSFEEVRLSFLEAKKTGKIKAIT